MNSFWNFKVGVVDRCNWQWKASFHSNINVHAHIAPSFLHHLLVSPTKCMNRWIPYEISSGRVVDLCNRGQFTGDGTRSLILSQSVSIKGFALKPIFKTSPCCFAWAVGTSIWYRELPAMATSLSNANWLLPPKCSSQSSAKVVPNRTICVGCGSLVSPPRSLSVPQDHTKFSPLGYGFCSLFGHGPAGNLWHGSSRWSSLRSRKQSRGGGIATASSAVDETALDEVGCALQTLCFFLPFFPV